MDFIDLRHLIPLVIIGSGFTFAGTVLYGAWLLGRYRGRDEVTPAVLVDVEARLERLEHAIDQATNAIDRLEAAHRLTARLLTSDRGSKIEDPSRRGARTPH